MFPRRSLIVVSLIVASVVLCAPGIAATITGTVSYEGRVPSLRPLQMDADPACAEKHDSPVDNPLLVLGSGNTLANVFVMVKSGLPDKQYSAPSEPVVMDQHGCMYRPHVLGVQTDQPFKILNSDGLLHNVHSLSKANPPFNRAMPANVKEAEFEFDKEEVMFKVKCDVHPWMSAFVTVIDHPFYAVTEEDGKFSIEGLPAGTYEIEARHEFERFPPQTATVTVGADETKSVDFTFKGPSN